MTTVIPELREALVAVAEEQATVAEERQRSETTGDLRRGSRLARRLRQGGLPLIAVTLLGTGGVAAATGFVVSQATKDRSEQLTTAEAPKPGTGFSKLGTQMVQTAKEVRAQLPYPPGMPDTFDWSTYDPGATLGTGGETRREIQLMSEHRAMCLWQRYYVKVHDAGDRKGMADAAAILAQAPNWPATRGLPQRQGRPPRPSDPTVEFARQAAQGVLTEQMRTIVLVNCTDGIDPRLRPGETQAEALARVKREARRAEGR